MKSNQLFMNLLFLCVKAQSCLKRLSALQEAELLIHVQI